MQNNVKANQLVIAFTGVFLARTVFAKADYWQLNMYKGVTPLSHDMYYLHMIAMLICAIIGVIVFGVMIYSLIYHRKSKGFKAEKFEGNTRLEILWTAIPFFILVGLAIPATQVLMRMDNSENSDVTIKVVGSQWKWQYQYLDQGISYFSVLATPYTQISNQEKKGQWYLLEVDKPLVVPVNKKIRFLVTSNDVIHSWWVPELGVKRDAIPGFMHEAWAKIEKPGTYRGQCAELCGINHGFMPIVVQAVSENEFEQWVVQQTKVEDRFTGTQSTPTLQAKISSAALMTKGRDKYEQICAACHRVDGKGLPPMFPPLKGSSISVGKPISRHIALILNGVPGSAMQAYKAQLTDAEIAAIVTYERNAWDNNTNDIVQPADVAKVRASNHVPPKIVSRAQVGGFR
ncbi:MAG: cytochrome c oxidase subunit II [Legionellales bacterium RIFCSPHIGHO2_12_FULL_42_9]|nr:MAG: cytochrome c oxidase subunit II [Legionellales bacterium RIFCSPHIGHO2_12_FULL_42_9]